MKVIKTKFKGLYLIRPKVHKDKRGSFAELINLKELKKKIKLDIKFVQDNLSISKKNVLRGLHYQEKKQQDKLIRCNKGSLLDVCVDLRKDSKTYGKYFSKTLNEKDHILIWIPKGFAHGFYAFEDNTQLYYKTTEYYYPKYERTIRWDSKFLKRAWKKVKKPILSFKDA
jgi:dTDP-4-dehydrorhamnose 3,5-epimerase